jgi:glycosyltransferase involved in cell wall biosynthesis
MDPVLYSIVVPVYNSEKSLEELSSRIDTTFKRIEGVYELILVDDGSSDTSWHVMQKLRRQNPQVKIIRLMRNFGQHNALICGLHHASGEYILTMDDDLQHPPEEIPKMIEAIRNSNDDVIFGGLREKKHSLIKNIGSYCFRRSMHLLFKHHPKIRISSFRIFRRQVLQHILQDKTPNPVIGPMLFSVTNKVGTIEVEHNCRVYGRTTYTMTKLVRQFLHAVLYYSAAPLKAIFWVGITSILLSFILACYYLIRYLREEITVPGWMTLVLLVLFFSGSIMFSLGIIGEYLLRIVQEVRWSPQYLIRDKEM